MNFTILSHLLLVILLRRVTADLYVHNPRGSNNRLNEKSAARKNANRMFDSQNNNRGGYNVGDSGSEKAKSEKEQYQMKYFQSAPGLSTNPIGRSLLNIHWTNQHGCGGDSLEKQNCVMVLQYMCQEYSEKPTADGLRNGFVTKTQEFTKPPKKEESLSDRLKRKKNNVEDDRGLQESWESYDECYKRQRNSGLFIADQKLKKNVRGYESAIYTRQNPNGDRRGYECPEERDYYPYWHPTPWKDIAVLADKTDRCNFYRRNSFNSQPYGACVKVDGNNHRRDTKWNNKVECEKNSGKWVLFHNYLEKAAGFRQKEKCESSKLGGQPLIWGVPHDATDVNKAECLVKLEPPECLPAPRSRSNHLGDAGDAAPLNYTWVLPHFPSKNTQVCVLRMRYNISTDDYHPHETDHKSNGRDKTPVQQNPLVNIGNLRSSLRLNINTNQYGRIFQDRTHVFHIIARPTGAKDSTIYNVNVRGKRGNIVQVYPAVEYDFHPTNLEMKDGDLVHIQWTGSNTHNNGQDAGDGAAGNDGQGKDGTDRHNIAQISDLALNFPLPFESTTMWNNAEVVWMADSKRRRSAADLAVSMASSGYYRCMEKGTCGDESVKEKKKLQKTLDNAPASYAGALLRFRKGTYHFMCTRNNNFSNRSQKGTILVK